MDTYSTLIYDISEDCQAFDENGKSSTLPAIASAASRQLAINSEIFL